MGQIDRRHPPTYGSRSQHGFVEDRDDRSVRHASIKCDSLNEEAAAGIGSGDLPGRDLHSIQSTWRSGYVPNGVTVAEVIDVDRIRCHDVDAGREVESGQNQHRELLSQPNFAGRFPASVVELLVEILLAEEKADPASRVGTVGVCGIPVNRLDPNSVDSPRNRDDILAVENVEGGTIFNKDPAAVDRVVGELCRPAETAGDKLIGQVINGKDTAAGDGLIEDAVSQFPLDKSILFIESLVPRL